MAYKMVGSPTLIVLVLVLVSMVVSEATNLEGEGICPALGYWNLKLPNTSIPNVLREAICPHHLLDKNIQGDASISSKKYIASGGDTSGGGDATIYSHKYFTPQVGRISVSSPGGDATIYSHKYITSQGADRSVSSQKNIPPRGGDATIYSHKYFTPQAGDISVSSQKYIPPRGGDTTTYSHKYITSQKGDISMSSQKYTTSQGADRSVSSQKYIPPRGGDVTIYSHKYFTPQAGDISVSSQKYIPPRGGDTTMYSHKYTTSQKGDISMSSQKYFPSQGGDVTVYSHNYIPPQGGDVTIYNHKYIQPQTGDVTLYNRKYIIDRDSSPKVGDITLDKDLNQVNVEYHRQLLGVDPLLSIFFFEKDLRIGTKLMVHLEVLKAHDLATFIPRSIADEIPFSLEKLVVAQDMLNIPQGSHMSISMEKTLKKCESTAISGETTYCATSMESMIDYSATKFGSNDLNVLVTDLPSKFSSNNHQYIVTAIFAKTNSSSKHAICHNLEYPYAIYMCHEAKGTRIFELSLKGQGTYGHSILVAAICHADTNGWNPEHAAFVALNVKPGEEGICHFVLEGTIVWLQAN